MVSNSLRSYMRSYMLRIAQSLEHVYKGRHLRVLPSFQSNVMLSSVTLNFELKKVVLSSCLARLLLVPVHFIESEH